jgi:hypothetical protein
MSELEAISEGRRRELERLEAAHRAEWTRAERAEAERNEAMALLAYFVKGSGHAEIPDTATVRRAWALLARDTTDGQ